MNWVEDHAFRRVDERLLVRRGVETVLESADTIIFDIDGVLIDVTDSFRYVICDTVQFYFTRILGISGTAQLLRPEDTHYFKMAGGFNSDWDLTEAAIAFLLWKMHTQGLHSLEELQRSSPSVQAFTQDLRAVGGGLRKVYEWVTARPSEEGMTRLRQQVDAALIRKIFQEHYAGEQYCRRLYGSDQFYYHGQGRIHNEKIILNKGTLRPGQFSYGILSGRTPEEIELAIELMGIDGQIYPQGIVADDGMHPTKPDPWGLMELTQRLNTQAGIYAGDTWDDLRTVLHYRERDHHPPMLFCYCLTGSTDEETLSIFKAKGADIIAGDINVFLQHFHT